MTNDPLGLEDSTQMEDLTLMVENFDILNRELDEMSREDDEEINHLKVQIMKIEERKKNLCKPLLIDIERLENKIREFILLAHQGVKVGRWSFGYSVRRSADIKMLEKDLGDNPGLAKYFKEKEIVTKRRS